MVLADLDFNSQAQWDTSYIYTMWHFVPFVIVLAVTAAAPRLHDIYDAISASAEDKSSFWEIKPEDSIPESIMKGFGNTFLSIFLVVADFMKGRPAPMAVHHTLGFFEASFFVIAWWQFVHHPETSPIDSFFDWGAGLMFAIPILKLMRDFFMYFWSRTAYTGVLAFFAQGGHLAATLWLYTRFFMHSNDHLFWSTWVIVGAALSFAETISVIMYARVQWKFSNSDLHKELLSDEKALRDELELHAQMQSSDQSVAEKQRIRAKRLATMRSVSFVKRGVPAVQKANTGRTKGAKGQRETSRV
jgi:hypothetical protein